MWLRDAISSFEAAELAKRCAIEIGPRLSMSAQRYLGYFIKCCDSKMEHSIPPPGWIPCRPPVVDVFEDEDS